MRQTAIVHALIFSVNLLKATKLLFDQVTRRRYSQGPAQSYQSAPHAGLFTV